MALGFQKLIRRNKRGIITSVDYYAPRHIRICFSRPTKKSKDQKSGSWTLYDDREGEKPVQRLTANQAASIFRQIAERLTLESAYKAS
jgi:hypothetical protein